MRAALLPFAFAGAFLSVGCGRPPVESTGTELRPPLPRAVATAPTAKSASRATTPAPSPPRPAARLVAPGEKWKGETCEVSVTFAGVLDDTLMVPVIVSTDSPKARVGFRAWREPFGGARGARLVDDNGTRYEMQGFDATIDGLVAPLLRERLKGDIGTGSGPIYADRPRVDVLLFDRPTASAEHLDLDLDAANVGEKGTIRFRIPRAAWAAKR